MPDTQLPSAAESGPFTITQDCKFPRPALTGNGELVTAFGPTGYHTEQPTPSMQVFCLAGRRLRGSTSPLVRFGRIVRRLEVDGAPSEAARFRQEIKPREGTVISTGEHGSIREDTVSFVSLKTNSAAFRTVLTNTSDRTVSGRFAVEYAFGDWEGHIPQECSLHSEALPGGRGMQVRFEVEKKHLGAVDIQCDRDVRTSGENGRARLEWDFTLSPGETDAASFLWGIGDKLVFRYTPSEWNFQSIHEEQKRLWGDFLGASAVDVGAPDLEALREICLYTLRCNSTPWSIPPCMSPSQWDGRTFHDELYPFLGLVSSGHAHLARKIPFYRLHTLPMAVERSRFRGAKFAWESLEDGGDGTPYGAFLEEHFHMGQFSETAWQMCLYAKDDLQGQLYPLFREIADYYLLNLIEYDEGRASIRECTDYDETILPVKNGIHTACGRASIRECTDYDETIFPVKNGMYTACAAIRSLETALRVGTKQGERPDKLDQWRFAAEKLRENLPYSPDEKRYLTAAGALHRHIAEAGPVFPFRIDPGTPTAVNTLNTFCEAVRTECGLQPGNLPAYGGRRWLWTASHVAAAYSLAGEPDRALEILKDAPIATAPGMAPAESVGQEGSVSLPFFTTSAGAFVFSLNSLFVQITDDACTRLPALPIDMPVASYAGLAGAHGLKFSALFRGGKCVRLAVESQGACSAQVLAHAETFPKIAGWKCVRESHEEGAFVRLTLELQAGANVWESEKEVRP